MHPVLHDNLYFSVLFAVDEYFYLEKPSIVFMVLTPSELGRLYRTNNVFFDSLSVCNRKHPPRSITCAGCLCLSVSSFGFRKFVFFEERLCDCPSVLQKQQGRDQFPSPWRGRILIINSCKKLL